MFAASKTDSVSGGPPDDKFNYVSMLLHGDGTNGAQNNTFLDSSASPLTITRNGNTTQGSFSPYGSNWSNFFAGSDYLTLASNTAFNIFGGDMTVECWFNATSLTNSPHLFAFVQDASNRESIYFNSGALTFYSSSGAGSGNRIATATISTGVWYHYALVKSGSTFTAYLNGVLVGTSTTTQYSTANQSLQIGTYNSGGYAGDNFNGYMSNVRVVKGTAVYTSSFTPSTTPLTAITNTQLLTSQSNRFVDNSASPLTITPTATSVQRFNPFGTSTAYSTSVIGGSGYFDGTGDYLSTSGNTSTAMGTGDFTWEVWVYILGVSGYQDLIDSRLGGNASNDGFALALDTGTLTPTIFTTTAVLASSVNLTINAWTHVALTRTAGDLKIWINGVSAGVVGNSTNLSNQSVSFGASAAGFPVNGYISNIRMVKGTAVYTSTFTPPTAPLTAISGTSLLLGMTNGAIFDNTMMNNLETVGNAQISTSVKKYGTGSLAFDGSGDNLRFPKLGILGFGTGNFTVECWLYPNANQVSYSQILYKGADDTFNFGFMPGTTTLHFYSLGFIITTTTALTIGAWSHVALVRSGTTLTIYINGTSAGSATWANDVVDNFGSIGFSPAVSGYYYDGYMDDFRITKGYARYTANFTPPTVAFSDTGPY